MSQATAESSHGSVDIFSEPPVKQARLLKSTRPHILPRTDQSGGPSSQATLEGLSCRPARRSARLAIQNRASRGQSTSATIQLSPVAGSPALSINPDEVIDLITPPHPHPAPISSTGTAFTSPTPSQNAHSFVPRAGPLDLFGDLSDSNNRVSHSAPVVPWMSNINMPGSTETSSSYSSYMYPSLLNNPPSFRAVSQGSNDRPPPRLVPTESLRRREPQRESVIRSNVRSWRQPSLPSLSDDVHEHSRVFSHGRHNDQMPATVLEPSLSNQAVSSPPHWLRVASIPTTLSSDSSGLGHIMGTGRQRDVYVDPSGTVPTFPSLEEQFPYQSSATSQSSQDFSPAPPSFLYLGSPLSQPSPIRPPLLGPQPLTSDQSDEPIPRSQPIHTASIAYPRLEISAGTSSSSAGPSTEASRHHPISPGPSCSLNPRSRKRALPRSTRSSRNSRNMSTSSGSASGSGAGGSSRPRSSRSDVLIVVDESDSDDDVIIESWVPGNGSRVRHPPPRTQLDLDEAYARQLQAQYNEENGRTQWQWPRPPPTMVEFGEPPVIPAGPSIPRLGESNQERTGAGIIRDNFDALASRVRGWTRQDATRFLHVATRGYRFRSGGRRPDISRHVMESANRMSTTMLIRAIIGDNPATRLSYEDLLELAENIGPAQPQGLDKTTIDRLPVRLYDPGADNEDQRCVVCMCSYKHKDKIRSLPCSHDYHQECIDQWLKDHKTCPICRVEVKSE